MKSKIYLCLFVAFAIVTTAKAQSPSTFENQPLLGPDTFYVNYSNPGKDVGFSDSKLYFPCVYDTGFGQKFWSSGFAYSNVKDSVTSGYGNQYAAKPGGGYQSSNYVVSYGQANKILSIRAPEDLISGMYISNTTYTFNSIRDGDFAAKKFGGPSGTDPDYFRLKINRYSFGVFDTTTSVLMLADFRSSNPADDYILSTWQYVPVRFGRGSNLPVAGMDSLLFTLESSDTGQFGINTPLYFAVDSITVFLSQSVRNYNADLIIAYPNPATNKFIIESKNQLYIPAITVYDVTGKEMKSLMAGRPRYEVNMENWPPGIYMVKAEGAEGVQTLNILKQ